jgi:hypothetical protein
MSWLISNALMNLLSLPEPVEEYLGENSLDGAQSAPLSGSHIQQAYCAPDKMTVFSRLSRYGMTYKPLTENLGEELLTLYLAGFPAKTLAQQERAQESTENEAECGEKWRASFTKYNPDLRLWKTHQCSLLEDLESFSETWPAWGLMRDGECWEQRTLEQTIRGTEYGLSPKGMDTFPTPTAHNSQEHACPSEYLRHTPTLATHAGGKLNPTWTEWLMGWTLGWTDLKPLEMDKSHCVQQPPGES